MESRSNRQTPESPTFTPDHCLQLFDGEFQEPEDLEPRTQVGWLVPVLLIGLIVWCVTAPWWGE